MRTILTTIRPTIEATTANSTPIEHFQNETLRPILKFQHDLLMQVMQQYFIKRKGEFFKIKEKAQLQYLEDAIRKDLRFKAMLQGLIIGLFSESEFLFYSEYETELSRRLTDLLIQRFQSKVTNLSALEIK
jgi:hypothetical protein